MQLKSLLLALACFFISNLSAQYLDTRIGQVSRTQVIERGGPDPRLKPFYHGVASGDPTSSSVMIWTRITPDAGQTSIDGQYFVATDTAFQNMVTSCSFTAEETSDFTVNIDISGLNAGSVYYYYFRALNANSLIGRAKTCPTGNVERLKFAVVSCSNYEGGYFNAYDAISRRNDIDAVIHLGDYIYEYGSGTYGINIPGRINEPSNEILTLADYRTRYSLYRLDPDLIRLHQQQTMINIWDDHESANNSWKDGAQNHNAGEGDWEVRKAISKQVYFEWMPIRPNPEKQVYRSLSYGPMCDLILLDTRLEGRVQSPPHFDTPDDPARQMISQTQYDWFMDKLKNSQAKWKVIGNQVLFSTFNVGFAAGFTDFMPDPSNIDSIRQVEDAFIDDWESHVTQRDAIIDSLQNGNIDNVVIITGDSHCSWAFDVTKKAVLYPEAQYMYLPQPNPYDTNTGDGYDKDTGAGSWAVEFGVPSISSPNFDESVSVLIANLFEAQLVNPIPPNNVVYNPHLKYVDLDRHGYFILDLNDNAAQADFYYVSTLTQDTTLESFGTALFTANGGNHLQATGSPTPPKATQDIPAPVDPPIFSTGVHDPESGLAILSCYPNPASDVLFVQLGFHKSVKAAISLYDANGRLVRDIYPKQAYEAGVFNLVLSVKDLNAGVYFLRLEDEKGGVVARRIAVE